MSEIPDSNVRIEISADTCTRCGRCAMTCPRKLIVRHGEEVRPVDDLTLCIECGHCVAVCEPNALKHSRVSPASAVVEGFSLTDRQLEQFLRSRRSIRRFKRQEVEPEKLERLFDIARHAPTGKNRQGVVHTVVTGERIRRLEVATAAFYRTLIGRLESPVGRLLVRLAVGPKALGEVMWGLPDLKRDVAQVDRGEPTYCHSAPVVVAVHGESSTTMAEDCSFAAYHLMLAAETLGLGTCLIGYVKAAADRTQAVRDVVELPEGHTIYSVVAIGYPSETFYHLVPRNPASVRRLT